MASGDSANNDNITAQVRMMTDGKGRIIGAKAWDVPGAIRVLDAAQPAAPAQPRAGGVSPA